MEEGSPTAAGLQLLRLQQTAKSGANWFMWIAALSGFNSISLRLDLGFGFLAGLGVTQLVDVLGAAFGPGADAVAMVINLMAIGLFIAAGRLALRHPAVYVVGMVAYLLDAVPLLVFKDFLGAGFHLFALLFMFKGFQAARSLHAAGLPVVTSVSAVIAPQQMGQQAHGATAGVEPVRLPASLQPLLAQIQHHYDNWRACCDDPFGDDDAAAAQRSMDESMVAFLDGALTAGADQESVLRTLRRRFPLATGIDTLQSTV